MVNTHKARTAASLLLVPALAASALTAASATPATARPADVPDGPGAGPGAPARDARFVAGAEGIGDAYFPSAGNGGYNATHYHVRLRYRPSGRISATTTIRALATQDLCSFNLDFVGNQVRNVTVDGMPASWRRAGQELTVTPKAGIRKGAPFTVAVAYDGAPDGRGSGWMRTPDGAITLSQPQGSATWFPLNDHPSDKALHAYTITVPKGLTVVANGEPVRAPAAKAGNARTTTFRWRSKRQMAGYLAMIAIGRFKTRDGRSPGGIRTFTAVDPTVKQDIAWFQRTTGQVTDWGVRMFGRYPFDSTGGIVDNVPVLYALETQNRPVYPQRADTRLIVHEIAHQWFGDAVSLRRWQDIWLNEGFATYAEWLWTEQHGGPTAAQEFTKAYALPANDPQWRQRPGAPGRKGMFKYFPTYIRGAMTVHALRVAVGDRAFFEILRTWAPTRRDGHATTADFIRHAERVAERRLRPVFHEWLYRPGKPVQPKSMARTGPN
ncbi:M1 family metallopeptidase [Actinomadura vinacea]|uniref:Aminopeptidase N n=1 Tax=Actinomadura vinacea TaxID=115336 RepID=A0ABN3J3Z5_9ACTN